MSPSKNPQNAALLWFILCRSSNDESLKIYLHLALIWAQKSLLLMRFEIRSMWSRISARTLCKTLSLPFNTSQSLWAFIWAHRGRMGSKNKLLTKLGGSCSLYASAGRSHSFLDDSCSLCASAKQSNGIQNRSYGYYAAHMWALFTATLILLFYSISEFGFFSSRI